MQRNKKFDTYGSDVGHYIIIMGKILIILFINASSVDAERNEILLVDSGGAAELKHI